jgi:ISXO2-like transposase domain
VHADKSAGWDRLHAYYEMCWVNRSISYSQDGACTNWAESYLARLCRAKLGQHHHISGKYLHAYAGNMAWKEDNRRQANYVQRQAVTSAALAYPFSRNWVGHLQRAQSLSPKSL